MSNVLLCSAISRPEYVGSRYTPEHVERRDTQSGRYEELNALASHDPRKTDLFMQRLLLTPTKDELQALKEKQ